MEQLPKFWREGRDPQLERTVEEALKLFEKNSPKKLPRAPYSKRVQ
jgi:hypothetical protein